MIRERTAGPVALLEAGDGPPVMLLHGFPDNAWTWSEQITALAAGGYHVVAPFLPGYPPSAPQPAGRTDLACVVATLADVATSLGEGPVALAGHDWGGTLTYLIAASRSEVVRRAVAIAVPHPLCAPGLVTTPELAHYAFHLWLFQLPFAATAVRAGDLALVDYLWRHWSPALDDTAHIARVKRETLSAPGAVESALGYYPAISAAVTSGSIPADPITVPTLTIFGGDDPVRVLAEHQDKHFAGEYRLDLVPGTGHFCHREQPDVVTGLLLGWFGAAA